MINDLEMRTSRQQTVRQQQQQQEQQQTTTTTGAGTATDPNHNAEPNTSFSCDVASHVVFFVVFAVVAVVTAAIAVEALEPAGEKLFELKEM